MILLREIQKNDLGTLETFANVPGFINLPDDTELLRNKIAHSIQSFSDQLTEKAQAKFLFVAEDLKTERVVGTSMIAAQHGTKDSPHFYFEVGKEEKFSKTINTGFIHGTLTLRQDTDGPTEIGGLIIDPEYRNSEHRVGRQISFVRFLYLGLHKLKFKRKVIAELLPPLNKKGLSPLWEAVGRRFTNMDYWEADRLCQKNKEFILSLFPAGKIYTTFLAAEARDSIGKVGTDTEPVFHMLSKIGFEYLNHVDPFDGGPHMWADVSNIAPIKRIGTFKVQSSLHSVQRETGLICKKDQKKGEFRALSVEVLVDGKHLRIAEPAEAAEATRILSLNEGEEVHFMPFY